VCVVCIRAEDDIEDSPELIDALAAVVAQQAQLAGGYLAASDASSPGGALVAGHVS
jgi:methylmalonyl-CoA mutase cobalamin-binding subunit